MALSNREHVALHRERDRVKSFDLEQLRARRLSLLTEFNCAAQGNNEKDLAALYLKLRFVCRTIGGKIEDAATSAASERNGCEVGSLPEFAL